MLKGPVARALRIFVAVGLTAFLLWQSDPAAILAAGRQANPAFIAIACAACLRGPGVDGLSVADAALPS